MDRRDIRRIEDFIKGLTEEELRYVNKLIIERAKLLAQARSTAEMARFSLGELVEFDAYGGTITGRILKLNKKTISVLSADQHQWNVSPGLLRRAERE